MALKPETVVLRKILAAARDTLVRCQAYWKTDDIGGSSCLEMATRIVACIPVCTFHANEARSGDNTPMAHRAHPQAELALQIETYDCVMRASK